MDCGTGEPEISLCTRSGMCRWHRINAPIFIAVYHCLEGRTLFKHESRSDSTHTREMSHLAKTEAVDQYPCCADFLLCLLFNVQGLKCVSCIATGGKHSYSVGNIVVPRPEKERHNLELTGQY